MKSSSRSLIHFLPSLLSSLRLRSQETPLIIISAGLGSSLYSLGKDPTEDTVYIVISQQYLIVACLFVTEGTCLPSRLLAMNVYSDSDIPAFRRLVTIYFRRQGFGLSLGITRHFYLRPIAYCL